MSWFCYAVRQYGRIVETRPTILTAQQKKKRANVTGEMLFWLEFIEIAFWYGQLYAFALMV